MGIWLRLVVVDPGGRSGFAVNLGPPPADADEEESPVAEKLRGLAFESVTDELQHPSHDKQGECIRPQTVHKNAAEKNHEREQDGRNAQRVAGPVEGVLMAGGILGNPLLVAAVA